MRDLSDHFSHPLASLVQKIVVLNYCLQFVFVGPLCTLFVAYLLFTRFYLISLLYLAWYIYDFKTGYQGGRRSELIRHAFTARYFARYFPIELIKTVDLPADRNYIFGCHPHGILSISHFANFATEGTHFSAIFPNLRPHMMAMNILFWMPLHREYVLSSGACCVSRESIEYVLQQKGTGNVVAIAIGGALKVVDSIPGEMILTLRKRKGFVRLAMQNGASIVPVISFGENDLYRTFAKENSWFGRLNVRMTKWIGFPVLIFISTLFLGKGLFKYTFGMLPFPKPITTIVGEPIEVIRSDNPSQNEIDQIHARYIEAVELLYEANKYKYNHQSVALKIK